MKIIFFLITFFSLFYINFALSFEQYPETKDIGTGGRDDLSYLNSKTSDFKKGKDALKQAIKYQKKNKIEKSNIRYEKALKYFVSAYENYPSNIDILNHLGFTYSIVGDLIMSEIYYQEALKIEPLNPVINQRIGKLYLDTERFNLAKERLNVLKKCNCKEYLDFKTIFEKIN